MIEGDGWNEPVEGERVRYRQAKLPSWRWEALRTTFWMVPTILVVVAGLLFVVTFEIDWAAYHRHLGLPFWIQAGSADSGLTTVRSSHDAELCQGHWKSGHPGCVCGDLCLLGAEFGLDHQCAPYRL